jgi:nucleoside-diphosphate-sugar epimerase
MSVVLLTGYRGFIGSALLEILVKKTDYKVFVVGSLSDTYTDLPPSVEAIKVEDIYAGILQGKKIDVVVNCANSFENTSLTHMSPLIVNLQFPLFILETVLGSASHFVNLDTSLNKNKLIYPARTYYSLTKKHFKEYLEVMSNRIKVSNLICEHVYGIGSINRKTLISEMIKYGLSGKHQELKMTKGEQIRDFVYVEDIASAILTVIQLRLEAFRDNYLDFEIGSGKGIPISQVANLIQEKLKLKEPYALGTMPYRQNEIMHSVANLKLINELGWNPSFSLSEGLDRIIDNVQDSSGD